MLFIRILTIICLCIPYIVLFTCCIILGLKFLLKHFHYHSFKVSGFLWEILLRLTWFPRPHLKVASLYIIFSAHIEINEKHLFWNNALKGKEWGALKKTGNVLNEKRIWAMVVTSGLYHEVIAGLFAIEPKFVSEEHTFSLLLPYITWNLGLCKASCFLF